jgi:hypothetical protein
MQSSRKFRVGDIVFRLDNHKLKYKVLDPSIGIGRIKAVHCIDKTNDCYVFREDEIELDKSTIINNILSEI